MKTKTWIERMATSVVLSVVLLIASVAVAQDGSRVIDYMLENRVSLFQAASDLRLNIVDVSRELGYPDFLYANQETVLLFAECWRFYPVLRGSAEDIGLEHDAIADYFALRMANDASFVPQCTDDSRDSEMLLLELVVWAVGDEYPVAHHLDFSANLLQRLHGDLRNLSSPVSKAALGFGNATSLEDTVRNLIDQLVEEFAMTMLRLRSLR